MTGIRQFSIKSAGLGYVLTVALLGVAAKAGTPTVRVDNNFDSSSLGAGGWTIGAQSGAKVEISKDATQNHAGSLGSLKASYPATGSGANYGWAAYSLSDLKTNDLYIDFWAKMPGAKQGFKFLKIFGITGAQTGYANTTFGLDYHTGSMTQVSFGDGSSSTNDTAQVINLDGTYPDWIGRSYGKATVTTPQRKIWAASNWGTSWHHFRIHVKFNTGTTAQNEVNDGEYFVEIDGDVYVDAKGLFNRHYSNLPIDSIQLLGWGQAGTQAFEIWYDDVKISTGGFLAAGPAPKPPISLSIN